MTSGKNLLIIEDEDELRALMRERFEELSIPVMEARNVAEAREILMQDTITVILSDLRMPGGDGISLLPSLDLLNYPRPRFFLLTAFGDQCGDLVRDKIVDGVFSKPLELNKAVEEIRRLFELHLCNGL